MTTARFSLHRYANPAVFERLASAIIPWSTGAAILLLGSGLYFALFASPPDYQQGESVRIMYVHVPAAIMSEMVYGLMAGAAAAGIVWKHALADVFIKAAAPLGAAFTLLCLVAGSLHQILGLLVEFAPPDLDAVRQVRTGDRAQHAASAPSDDRRLRRLLHQRCAAAGR
jgi:ABC-type transport system involved in cytochrome c biogenesis permease subunit